MEWWTNAQQWIVPLAAIFGLLLSIGNTAKLIIDVRRQHREDKRKKVAEALRADLEEKLETLVRDLRASQPGISVTLDPDYEEAGKLGMERGVLSGWWSRGVLHARLSTPGDK